MFDFTAMFTVHKAATPESWLGVDLGIVKTWTASVVGARFYTRDVSDTRQIRALNSKITRLNSLIRTTARKRNLNKDRHASVYAKHSEEVRRLRRKVARLKNERAHATANILVRIAKVNDTGIALEDLGWVPGSRWEQSLVQTRIKDEAAKRSVAVKKVSARHTSTTCSRCSGTDTRFRGAGTVVPGL